MSIALIAGILVIVVIAAIAIGQRTRPRVTIIETKHADKDGDTDA